MDRKKIYIGIILVCFLATGGILYFNFFGGSTTSTPPTIVNNTPTTSTTASAPVASRDGTIIYSAPAVFPSDTKFDWTLLDAPKYKALIASPNVTLDPAEIGRPDPFKPY